MAHIRPSSDGHGGSSTTSAASVVGHLRTTRANAYTPPRPGRRAHSSVVECLLCKEDALGSNPSGSIPRIGTKPRPLSGTRRNVLVRRPMHHPVKAWLGRVRCTLPRPPGRGDDDRVYVQSRRPLDPIHRVTVTYPQQRGYCAAWWMARLERRRRTCQAAISLREPHGGEELRIS